MALIKLPKCRISYPNLFQPRAFQEGTPKFSATFLFEPDHPAVKIIEAATLAAANAAWPGKGPAMLKSLKAAGRVFTLRDGNEKVDEDGSPKEGYAGNMFIGASNAKRPQVVDADGKTPLVEADGKPYGGCNVVAYVDIYGYENKGVKGIYTNLVGVQFHSDNEAFGNVIGPIAFESLEEEEPSLV